MEHEDTIEYLFRKFLADAYTADDFRKLQAYFRTDAAAEVIKQLIHQTITDESELGQSDGSEVNRILENVDARLSDRLFRTTTRSIREFRVWFPYAAAILILVSIGIISYTINFTGEKKDPSLSKVVDPQPGTNLATLKLADGTTVELSNGQRGIVMDDKPTYADGSDVLTNEQIQQTTRPLTLSTPNGGTYRLTLHDGTTVWLNSSSTLVYPSRFESNERVVHLTGEAYFAVKPSAQGGTPVPFKVITGNQTVHVLGTEFNVSAYAKKKEVKTTLVTGSVAIAVESTIVGHLSPGQQATSDGKNIQVTDVDVRRFTGWKDGVFYFDRTPLVDAMEAVGRWYDVEVLYEGTVPHTLFYGEIGRDRPLSEVLAVLKEGGVNFRVESQEGKPVLIVSEERQSTTTKNKKEVLMAE